MLKLAIPDQLMCRSLKITTMKNRTKDIDMVYRELKLLLVTLVVGLSEFVICEEGIPVSVHRRLGGDTYWYLNSSDPFLCRDDKNLTYLVNERRCMKNQELFTDSGKHYSL